MNYQLKLTLIEQEASLQSHKILNLDKYVSHKKIGASNFAVLEGRIGMEKIAIKSIPYRAQNYPREAVIKEMYTMFACSGGRNIINFVGWQEDPNQGFIYLATGYCEDNNLSYWIRCGKRRTPLEKFEMLKGVIAGISYIHLKGLIHNDIKPDNILISNGEPRIGDFGSAGFPGDPIRGTRGFICPESMDSGGDQKSDTYSFGATAFQVYTGDFTLKSHPRDFRLTEATIPDTMVLQILERVLVAKAQRLNVIEITHQFPATSTLAPASVASTSTHQTPIQNSPSRPTRPLRPSASAQDLFRVGNNGDTPYQGPSRPSTALGVRNEEPVSPPAEKPRRFSGLFVRRQNKPRIPEEPQACPEISKPTNFQHIAHVGYDSQRGFTARNPPPGLTTALKNTGHHVLATEGWRQSILLDDEEYARRLAQEEEDERYARWLAASEERNHGI